jgi:outer membrane lipoprotein carrier protein
MTLPCRRLAMLSIAGAFFSLFLGASRPAQAGALEDLRAFSSGTTAARGEFVQQTLSTSGRPSGGSASGTFAFARPGKFRWEVIKPFEQLVVLDGEKVYFFDKDLRQVTVRKSSEALSATPAALLFGSTALDAAFALSDAGESEGLAWLDAVPRKRDSGFERIRIGFRAGLPVAMEVKDAFGQTTRYAFRNLERNPRLDAGLFRFTAPAGVDVIE